MSIRIAAIDDQMNLPDAVRLKVASNLGDITQPEGAELSATIAEATDVVVKPEQFGAVGDLMADDRVALQSAADAVAVTAAAGGNSELLLRGKYLLSVNGITGAALTIKPGVILRGVGGATLKVKDGTGNFFALLRFDDPALTPDGVNLSGIRFDMNQRGNPLTDKTTLPANPRFAFLAYKGIGHSIRDCVFFDHTGTNTISINGPQTDHVTITGNKFLQIGDVTSGQGHDHSTIYTSAFNVNIESNVFVGANPRGARAAIETHCGRTIVANNQATGYTIFANITGQQPAARDGANILIHDNTGTDLMLGILLWSGTPSGTVAPGLKNVDIHDNAFTIDRDYHLPFAAETAASYPAGIHVTATSDLHTENVSIHDNTIEFKPYSSPALVDENIATGIQFYRTVAVDGPDLNVRIDRNTIVNSPGPGIRVSDNVKRLSIKENIIVDSAGTNHATMASSYRTGIFIAGTQNDATISGNTIVDSRAVHLIQHGIYTATITAVVDGRVSGNSVRCIDGTALAGFTPAAGAGKAFHVEHTMPTWLGVFQPVASGSRVLAADTGLVRVQTAAPTGTVWALAKAGRLSNADYSAGTTLGTLANKLPVYNAGGDTIIGYVPIYNTIT